MFIGELLCLLLFVIKQSIYGRSENKTDLKTDMMLAIPAIFDIISTSLMFIGLTTVAGSVYQMMRGFVVVITAFMALIFLGRKQYIHHWVSLLSIVMGIVIVGIVSTQSSKNDDSSNMSGTSV